jgi:hypothetical protein
MTEPTRPNVPAMLAQLEGACRRLLALHPAAEADAQRLMIVLEDFRWYAERLGEQASAAAEHPAGEPLRYFVDHGKEHVGQAAELLAIFSYDEGQAL